MLILTIRQAEVALADGRLEEAMELLSAADVRSHRKGQAAITRLVEALIGRGRAHLEAGRAALALADCGRAQRIACGGDSPQIAALRQAAEQAAQQQRRGERAKAAAVAAAREHIDGGHLGAAHRILAGASAQQDTRAAALLQDLESRRQSLDEAIGRAELAVGRDDIEQAVSGIERARQMDASDHRLVEISAKVSARMREQIESAAAAGRLDQASLLMDLLVRIDGTSLATESLKRGLDQCRAAWAAIEAGRMHEAAEALRRLKMAMPKAPWIDAALKQAEAAEEATEGLRAGPLGMLETAAPANRGMGASPMLHEKELHGRGARATKEEHTPVRGDLPSKFVLQVDGAGSFLVLRQAVVTVGPISSSRLPDVGLIAEPGASVVTIERVEDDYFMRSSGVAIVNDRQASGSRLLAGGDRIAISPRCRLSFALPNPASTSAVLDLASGRFPRADLRRVILLDRDLVIGPGPTAHVRADQMIEPVVLHVRDGRMMCGQQVIAPGQAVEVGGVGMVVTKG